MSYLSKVLRTLYALHYIYFVKITNLYFVIIIKKKKLNAKKNYFIICFCIVKYGKFLHEYGSAEFDWPVHNKFYSQITANSLPMNA